MEGKIKIAIRQMVCNHYECSDGNDKQYPNCVLKNLYPTCPYQKVEYVIESALMIAKKIENS